MQPMQNQFIGISSRYLTIWNLELFQPFVFKILNIDFVHHQPIRINLIHKEKNPLEHHGLGGHSYNILPLKNSNTILIHLINATVSTRVEC